MERNRFSNMSTISIERDLMNEIDADTILNKLLIGNNIPYCAIIISLDIVLQHASHSRAQYIK